MIPRLKNIKDMKIQLNNVINMAVTSYAPDFISGGARPGFEGLQVCPRFHIGGARPGFEGLPKFSVRRTYLLRPQNIPARRIIPTAETAMPAARAGIR